MAALPQQLSISLIKTTLGAGTNKLSELCRHVNINMFSFARPYDRRTGNAGLISRLNVPEFTTPAAVPTFGWSAILPVGGETSPFKMGDFVGYNHDEPIPLGVKKSDLSVPAVINPNTDSIRIIYTKGSSSLLQSVTNNGNPYGIYIEGTDNTGAKRRFYQVGYDGLYAVVWNSRSLRRMFPNIERWNLTMYFVVILVRRSSSLNVCPDGTPFRLFPALVHKGIEYINKIPLKFSPYYEYIEVGFYIMPFEPAGYFCPGDTVLDYVMLAYKKDGTSENIYAETGVDVWTEPLIVRDFRKDIYSYIEIRMREPGSRRYPSLNWSPTVNFDGTYRTTGDAGYDKEWIFTFRGGESDCEVRICAPDPNTRPD